MRNRLPRILLVIFIVLLLVCGGVFAFLIRPDPPQVGVIPENVERIAPGMTQTEVQGVLGTSPTILPPRMCRDKEWLAMPSTCERVMFYSNEIDLWVFLDADSKVIGHQCDGDRCSQPLWVVRLNRHLGR